MGQPGLLDVGYPPGAEHGIRLMLDDFGTGFSSLGYLKRFPVDTLKIDRSFVAGLGHDDGDRAIVAAIMGIAGALELEVVAEGVETAAQAAELAALGCTVAQGFRYAEPTCDPAATLDGGGVDFDSLPRRVLAR